MNREEMMKRFDTDGDGRISDEERAAARERMEQWREEFENRRGNRDGDREQGEE